jgi:glycyl-tRNA synthetase
MKESKGPTQATEVKRASYEEILRLALERGFFYPAAEIYSETAAGFWDYGPLGLLMKSNFIREWRRLIVGYDEMLEIDGSLILPKAVFEASGHLSSLIDPLVQCTKCGNRIRADKYISERTGVQVDERLSPEQFQDLIQKYDLKCPKCNGLLGKPIQFNMMFRVGVGAEDSDAYLRPETAQSIFLDFSRLSKTMRIKLPKGIAQVGKSFRNEISPRQSLIRLREIIQAEIEVFFNPNADFDSGKFARLADVKMNILSFPYSGEARQVGIIDAVKLLGGREIIAYYFALLQRFYEAIGFNRSETRFRELGPSDRAFYAASAFDFEVNTSLGWIELVACNYRTDYDLSNHAKASKKDLTVMDNNEKIIPHVVELSLGVDRSLFCLLDLYFVHESERDVLRLPPNVSPYLAAIFPLISKPEFEERARRIYDLLRTEDLDVFYDDSGNIGRRYRRMDEVGTPFCITVDHQSLQDNTVTIRERDSMKQERVLMDELPEKLRNLRKNAKTLANY